MPAHRMRAPTTTTTPATATSPDLEHALRAAVRNVYRSGKLEDLTVRRIRKMVEGECGLGEGWFKASEGEGGEEGEGGWKERSKRIIEGEVDACANADPSSQLTSAKSTPIKKRKTMPSLITGLKDEEPEEAGRRKKRKTVDDKGGSKKHRRKDFIDDDVVDDVDGQDGSGSEFEEERVDGEEAQNLSRHDKRRRATSTLSPPPEETETEMSEDVSVLAKSKSNGPVAEESESEMSELIDEPPKKRARPKAKNSEFTKQEKNSAPKAKKRLQQQQQKPPTTAEESADPAQEEIKRLQGWLVKCGIRKMWWKELQPYETSKAKINHLKEMLTEAGMGGRYSMEKANQIREERELRADLEAVQEGAKIWGTGKDEGGTSGVGARPRRQIAKGLQGLDFLNDEDGEETD